MNGNWGGIASRDFERIRVDDHGAHGGDYDPSLDVINTIVSNTSKWNTSQFFTIDRLICRFKC